MRSIFIACTMLLILPLSLFADYKTEAEQYKKHLEFLDYTISKYKIDSKKKKVTFHFKGKGVFSKDVSVYKDNAYFYTNFYKYSKKSAVKTFETVNTFNRNSIVTKALVTDLSKGKIIINKSIILGKYDKTKFNKYLTYLKKDDSLAIKFFDLYKK